VDAAIAEYRIALQLRPGYVEAHTNLATVLATVPGHLLEAVREYQSALQINPASVEAHYDLALVLARIPGRTDEAIAELEAVLRLHPNFAPAREMLEELKRAHPPSPAAGH
jgi:tetratricopeptide (TPR) repeat protein